MELAREMIMKAEASCKLALKDLDSDDIRRTLGDLDFVQDRIKAAKIILRDELKERKNNNGSIR